MPLTAQLNDWAWRRLPLGAARFSALLFGILSDGIHLSAWPLAGAIVPPAALVIGFILGFFHIGFDSPDAILYLYALPAVALLIALSQHGSAIGLAAWIGYGVGDFLWAWSIPGSGSRGILLVTEALEAVVLAWPLMVTPLGARLLAAAWLGPAAGRIANPRSDARLFTAMAIAGAATFVLAFLWVQAAPVLLQAVYVWRGMTPMTHGLVQNMHGAAWPLALLAANAAAFRIALEFVADAKPALAARRAALMRARAALAKRSGSLPAAMSAGVKAAAITFMLGTLIGTWAQAAIVFGVLFAVMLARDVVVGQLHLGPLFFRRGNIPARFVAGLALVYFGSYAMVPSTLGGVDGYVEALVVVVIAIAIMAALLPVRET